MNAVVSMHRTWRAGGVFAALSLAAAAQAADLLDAPGPGYREQSEGQSLVPGSARLRKSPGYRPELLDALPPMRREKFAPNHQFLIEKLRKLRGIHIYPDPQALSLEIQQLNATLPELPTTNPFERPIRLFDSRGGASSNQGSSFAP
jgi:hypothetical protein